MQFKDMIAVNRKKKKLKFCSNMLTPTCFGLKGFFVVGPTSKHLFVKHVVEEVV